jgi:dTDP-4-amino-4,6-dideoxygalactose transaminase
MRRQAAARYNDLLSEIPGITLPKTAPGNEHVWHLYVVQVSDRDMIVRALNERGIQAAIHYPVPVHMHPVFRHDGWSHGDFPVAEAASARILSLPIYPHITADQQRTVAAVLTEILMGENGR